MSNKIYKVFNIKTDEELNRIIEQFNFGINELNYMSDIPFTASSVKTIRNRILEEMMAANNPKYKDCAKMFESFGEDDDDNYNDYGDNEENIENEENEKKEKGNPEVAKIIAQASRVIDTTSNPNILKDIIDTINGNIIVAGNTEQANKLGELKQKAENKLSKSSKGDTMMISESYDEDEEIDNDIFDEVLTNMEKIAPKLSYVDDRMINDELNMIFQPDSLTLDKKEYERIKNEMHNVLGNKIDVKFAQSQYAPEQKKIYIGLKNNKGQLLSEVDNDDIEWLYDGSGKIEIQVPRELILNVCHSGNNEEEVNTILENGFVKEQLKKLTDEEILDVINEYGYDESALEEMDRKDLEKHLIWNLCWDNFDRYNSEEEIIEESEELDDMVILSNDLGTITIKVPRDLWIAVQEADNYDLLCDDESVKEQMKEYSDFDLYYSLKNDMLDDDEIERLTRDEKEDIVIYNMSDNGSKPVSAKLVEDTVKQGNSWVNKGKKGTHGKFKSKKQADAQRKAMFARGYKAESYDQLNEDKFDREAKQNIKDYEEYNENEINRGTEMLSGTMERIIVLLKIIIQLNKKYPSNDNKRRHQILHSAKFLTKIKDVIQALEKTSQPLIDIFGVYGTDKFNTAMKELTQNSSNMNWDARLFDHSMDSNIRTATECLLKQYNILTRNSSKFGKILKAIGRKDLSNDKANSVINFFTDITRCFETLATLMKAEAGDDIRMRGTEEGSQGDNMQSTNDKQENLNNLLAQAKKAIYKKNMSEEDKEKRYNQIVDGIEDLIKQGLEEQDNSLRQYDNTKVLSENASCGSTCAGNVATVCKPLGSNGGKTVRRKNKLPYFSVNVIKEAMNNRKPIGLMINGYKVDYLNVDNRDYIYVNGKLAEANSYQSVLNVLDQICNGTITTKLYENISPNTLRTLMEDDKITQATSDNKEEDEQDNIDNDVNSQKRKEEELKNNKGNSNFSIECDDGVTTLDNQELIDIDESDPNDVKYVMKDTNTGKTNIVRSNKLSIKK